MLKEVSKRLDELDIHVEFTDAAKKALTKAGFDVNYGARPLRRAIQKTVEDRLSEKMLSGDVKKGDSVVIDAEGDELKFNKKEIGTVLK